MSKQGKDDEPSEEKNKEGKGKIIITAHFQWHVFLSDFSREKSKQDTERRRLKTRHGEKKPQDKMKMK